MIYESESLKLFVLHDRDHEQGCTVCPAGTYSTPNSQYCVPCAPGMFSTLGASQCFFCGGGLPDCPENASTALCPGIGYGAQWAIYSDVSGSEGVYSCLLYVSGGGGGGVDWWDSVLQCPLQNSQAKLLTTAGDIVSTSPSANGSSSLVSFALSIAPAAAPLWVGAYQALNDQWYWIDDTTTSNLNKWVVCFRDECSLQGTPTRSLFFTASGARLILVCMITHDC